MPQSQFIPFPLPVGIRLQYKTGNLSPILSSDFVIICAALLVAALGFHFGEKIQIQGGLGWDGAIYATLTRNINQLGAGLEIDAYRVQRLAPCIVVHYALRGLGMELSDANVIRGFGTLNIACVTLLAWFWCRIARSLEISDRGKWLGFCGLFLNYAIAKNASYYPVLTDVSAMTIGGGMVCCYLESRQRSLLALTLIGAFTWPTLMLEGFLLALFPRSKHRVLKRIPAPAKMNVVIAAILAYYYVMLLVSIHHRVQGPVWNGVTPVRSVIGLSMAIAAAYVFYVAYRLLDDGRIFDFSRILRPIVGTNGIMVLSFVLAIKFLQSNLANLPATLNPQTYVLLIGTWSMTKPGVFLLAQTVFYGPLVVVAVLLWKPTSRMIHSYGMGVTLAAMFALANALDSEARHLANFVPLLIPFAVKATDALNWTWRQSLFLVALSIFFSKCWFTINEGTRVGNQFLWPDQRYAMSVGPYMNDQSYLIQGTIFLITASAIYWTCVQPGTTNAKLADDQSESHLAA